MAEEEKQVQLQASNALSHCIRTAPSSFIGSSEAVECHRLLLVAGKLTLYYTIFNAQIEQMISAL
jgi:hypothetical protein